MTGPLGDDSLPVLAAPSGRAAVEDTLPPGRTRRGTELVMLGFALVVTLVAYTAVGLAKDGQVPEGLLSYGAGLGGLFLVAHLVVRFLAPYADPLILPCVALLNGLGLVLITRLDNASDENRRLAGKTLLRHDAPTQLVWTGLAVVLFCGVLLVVRDHTRLSRYGYLSGAFGVGALLLPLLPFVGRNINGARLWVRVGPVQVQPSEAAKVLLMIFFASYLVSKRDVLSLAARRVAGLDLPRARDLGPVLLAWGASLAVLVFQRDLGSSLLFFGLFIAMLYIATERVSWLVIGLGLFLGGSYVTYRAFGHVQARIDTWLHPFADPQGAGFQLTQSLFGFGTGGLTGTGLGRGSPDKVGFAVKTDFIFTSVGEELGLVGVMAVLILFALVVERGMRASLGCRDGFGKLLAAGLSFALALQVFVIVGGVMGLIPLTGVTLPWLSYGGSSVVANWVLVALLMRISDAARRPAPAPVNPGLARAALAEAHTTVIRR